MERSVAKTLTGFERLLLVVGFLLVAIYVVARIFSVVSSRAELRQFWRMHMAATTTPPDEGQPDFRLWSEKRIAAYKASRSAATPSALAVLKIPAIRLEVPVLEGTDDLTLNQGVGHVEGTPLPEKGRNVGNVGIAGHRDGFFRGLKDIHTGDVIDLITQTESRRYVVDEILIVSPEDTWVLQPRPLDSLTLVTCYPFYFVGSAPQRFIVYASIADPDQPANRGEQNSSAEKGGYQEKK
jgi:sortase A